MGPSIARRSSRHLIDSFAPGPIYFKRFTEVSVFSQAFYFDVANPLLDGSEETATVSGLDVRRMGIDLRVQAL